MTKNENEFESYRERVLIKDQKNRDELRAHLITYLAVNTGLFVLNMITSSWHPWFLYVLGGWGIGVASHWGESFVSAKNINDISLLKGLDSETLNTMIQFHKKRSSFYLHVISNLSVIAFLFVINTITYSGFMWAIIPALAMGIGIASHWAQYSNKSNQVNTENTAVEDDVKIIIENEQLQRATTLRNSIIVVIKEIRGKFKNFASDLLPRIDTYVETIDLLTQKEEDLKNSLNDVSDNDLKIEKENLISKKDSAESILLKEEYENSIKDIDTHLLTIKRVREQHELLELKITSSINSLKHLNLELVAMKSKTTLEDSSILDEFEKKSSDLAIYYKDLLESYDELHK